MDYTITVTDPRLVAGIAKQTARYNAGNADAPLTEAQFLAAMLAGSIKGWADELAPNSIPTGTWLQRWTPEEQAGAFTLGAQSDVVKALWLKLLDHATVELDNPDLVSGVPQLCAALEQAGVIAAGQGSVRAAAILAY